MKKFQYTTIYNTIKLHVYAIDIAEASEEFKVKYGLSIPMKDISRKYDSFIKPAYVSGSAKIY